MPNQQQNEMTPQFDTREVTPPEERVLNPDEQVQVDLTMPLVGSHEMHNKLGVKGDLIATISAGKKNFMIVDASEISTNRDYFIIDNSFSMEGRKGFKGLEKGEPVVIGREHYTGRFDYPGTVSRDHFEVTYDDDGLFVRNLRPTNRTTITAHTMSEESPRNGAAIHHVEDMRTRNVEERMRDHPNFGEKDDTAPYGYYLNHPIIGRASKSVEGGVYMGGSAREAIVVDGKSVAMQQVYEGIKSELQQSFSQNETLPLHAVLLKVMNRVQEVMPYDGPKTDDVSRQHHDDRLVGLSTYLKERAGVCRHQALSAAFVIENLVNDGHMTGSVGVERNTVYDLGGTHAWAVYKTQSNGADEVIVIDPAQSFVGTKAQAQREGRWEYRLTSDKY